ncbi:MAG: hypothetical protein OEL53_18055 [Rhodospirillales bacterium]|nr:hypothetical protein [Rhodospirillales bacterium]
MTRSRSGFMFLRMGSACLLLMGMALFTTSAWAEGDKQPKLSKAEKAYIQRMIDYGKEEKQYPDKKWMYQGCRLNMNGTWYPYDPRAEHWLGRMVLTGDSAIFEKIGEIPYEIVRSEYGPEVPPGGALPRRERHIFKLSQGVFTGLFSGRKDSFLVIANPPWSRYKKKPEHWIFRCVPDFGLCPTFEAAMTLFEDKEGFEEGKAGCSGFNFIPYTDD